jgi:hypothetical protein
MHHRRLLTFLVAQLVCFLRFSLQVLIELLKPYTSFRAHPKPPKRRRQWALEFLAMRERSASRRRFAGFKAEEVVAVEEQGDCAAPHELFLGVFLGEVLVGGDLGYGWAGRWLWDVQAPQEQRTFLPVAR